MKQVTFYIPVEIAETPADGPCLVGSWWSVHPDKGLAFWAQLRGYGRSEEPSPQCNQSEATSRALSERLYPDHEVRKMPVVFLAHASKEMRRLRATGDA